MSLGSPLPCASCNAQCIISGVCRAAAHDCLVCTSSRLHNVRSPQHAGILPGCNHADRYSCCPSTLDPQNRL